MTSLDGPYFRLSVADVIAETDDSKSIVFDLPEELIERFKYASGQFLSFRIEVDGHRLVRCYSLASAPVFESHLKVTVKRVAEGRASNWLNDHVARGVELEVMPPNGIFCLRERETPIVFFGGGSGITPIISIIKTALRTTSRTKLRRSSERRSAALERWSTSNAAGLCAVARTTVGSSMTRTPSEAGASCASPVEATAEVTRKATTA